MSLSPGVPAVVFVALSPLGLFFFDFRAMESVLGAIASGGTHWAALGRRGPGASRMHLDDFDGKATSGMHDHRRAQGL